jgi:hypothetical protein
MTMTWTKLRQGATRTAACVLLLLATTAVAGCGLLDVTDPTKLDERDVSNATGADLMRRDAIRLLYTATPTGALASGLLADEFFYTEPLQVDLLLDLREADEWLGDPTTSVPKQSYESWQAVRPGATLALRRLEANAPEPPRSAHMGQMFAVRGYATLRLGEDFCPGFPLHELDGYTPVYGPPLTTEQVFERALADLDSAVVLAADSARILNFARVARGRTLLGLGRFAEAADAVRSVSTDFVANGEYDEFLGPLNWLYLEFSGYSVADRDGGNGLDFVSASDPRVQTTEYDTAPDGVTGLFLADKYSGFDAPIVLASGVEARLIEAEAALQAGDGAWLTIINDLRATQIAPPLPALSDPGTPEARVDLLFRERAFWLFGTGQRLADLRRLIRQYGRAPEVEFPTGTHVIGLPYGTATSIPFPAVLETPFSPEVTGCTGP